MRTFLAALSLPLFACSSASAVSGDPPPIHASDYDQQCAAASDCAVVNEGSVCGCLGCGGAAVNKSVASKYEADLQARRAQCTTPPTPCPAACIYVEATCNAGTCGVCHSPGCGDAGAPDGGPLDAAHD